MEFAEQIKVVKKMNLPIVKTVRSVAVCGMGGSGIAGFILKDLLDEKPVFILQSYELPKFVNNEMLVFCISYSGNTAETISMHRQAKKRGCKTIVITSGGILSKEKGAIIIPSGLEPRQALGYMFFTLWKILGKNFDNVASIIESITTDEGIAKKIKGKIPVIYANSGYSALSLRWKQQLNEDSKILAISNVFPELNHNEIEARYKNAIILFLKAHEEKAINLLKKGENVLEIVLRGKTKLEKMFYGLALANIVSVELAGLNGEDYKEYRYIEKLKKLRGR